MSFSSGVACASTTASTFVDGEPAQPEVLGLVQRRAHDPFRGLVAGEVGFERVLQQVPHAATLQLDEDCFMRSPVTDTEEARHG
jgi:hypothetical protein